MDAPGGAPSYGAMKWGLMAVLFCIAPAPVIVFQSFQTGPVIFVAATLVALAADAMRPTGAAGAEIIGFFAVHLAIYLFLYGVAASAVAKALTFIADPWARGVAFAGLAMAAGGVAFLPLYGGAGLYGGAFGPITFFFRVLNRSHFGPDAVLAIYGPAALILGVVVAVWWIGRARARGGGA